MLELLQGRRIWLRVNVRCSSLLALFALGLSCEAVCAATAVAVKNESPASVQLGFDGGAAMTIAPRATARFSLNAGEHSAQCRFEGGYDGCNLDDRFTIGDANVTMSLRPLYRLQHAVALAQQGMLAVETRQDSIWATATLDVPGTSADCADYEAGKLGAVAKPVRTRTKLRNLSLATQNLCGEQRPVIGAAINGELLYIEPRFLTFRDRGGHLVLVRP
jgi:hypothetical protein